MVDLSITPGISVVSVNARVVVDGSAETNEMNVVETSVGGAATDVVDVADSAMMDDPDVAGTAPPIDAPQATSTKAAPTTMHSRTLTS